MGSILEVSYDQLKGVLDTINLLIVTANSIETYQVRQVLKPIAGYQDVLKVPHGMQTYFIGTFGEYAAIHVQCGDMGTMRAAASIPTVMNAIDDWQPKVVLMIGVAMGVDEEKQNIGDVLVAETIVPYEIQRLSANGINQRNEIVAPGPTLLNRFKNVTDWSNPINEDGSIAKILNGQILSGEKLIDNLKEKTKILRRFKNAIGAEMEGAGVYAACRNKQVSEWILIKGICDYGDGNKGVDKGNRQNKAAQSATSLCLKVFSSRIGFKPIGLNPIPIPAPSPDNSIKIEEVEPQKLTAEILEIITPLKDMLTPIQSTISAFLNLNPIQKATVIRDIGIPLEDLTSLNAHEMDREVFRQVKEKELFSILWQSIHKLKPFTEILNNPFL